MSSTPTETDPAPEMTEPANDPQPDPQPDPHRPPVPPPAELTGPAVGTLAWGLVVLAVAGVLLLTEVTDVSVDLSYVLPVGMVALGLLLLVGAVATGIRRR